MADTVSRTIRALQRAGFRGERLKTAFGIVMRESGGNPQARNTNRSTGDNSYGLAQINMLGSLGPARRKQFGIASNDQLLNPDVNARAMYRLSGGGKDFGAWGIGPNAYRQGAGYDTIARFVNQFPGAAAGPNAAGPAAVPSSTARPGGNTLADGLALYYALRAQHGRDSDIVDRTGSDPGRDNGLGPYLPRFEDGSGVTPLQQLLEALSQRRQPVQMFPARSGLGKLQRKAGVKGEVRLPASYRGTHVTDGLGWGTRTARDFMAPPGTPVGSPADGVVEYFHPEGAQGGGSMLIRGHNGQEYWLGHIAQGVRPGTRVRRGQPVAVVADQNVSAPHVHEDHRRAR